MVINDSLKQIKPKIMMISKKITLRLKLELEKQLFGVISHKAVMLDHGQ